MVVQLLLFYYVALPLMGINLPSVSVAIAVFGLNSGAYISEIMRSGILSVDGGQMEAGFTLLDLYEDTNGEGRLHELNIPTFLALRAKK